MFSLPFPYRVVEMPDTFMKEWKARAQELSLQLSIRAMRNTWHREGLPHQSDCSNVLSLVAPRASGSQLRETAVTFAAHLVMALHDCGLQAPIDVDEGTATTDDIDEDDYDEKEITMYGITTYVRRGHMHKMRVPVARVGCSEEGVACITLGPVRYRPKVHLREAPAPTPPVGRSRSPSVRAAPAAVRGPQSKKAPAPAAVRPPQPKRGPKPAGGVPPATGGVPPAAGCAAAGGASPAAGAPSVAVPKYVVSLSPEPESPMEVEFSRVNLERQAREACKLAEAVMPFLQKGDMNFATHIKKLAEAMLQEEASSVESSVEVAFCISTYCRTQQVVSAIPLNVVECWPFRHRVGLVLVDFNEAEGDRAEIQKCLRERCPAALETGLLRYFELAPNTTQWQGWHASVAKNTTHMAAIACYGRDVCLVNLDGDNWLTRSFLEHILQHAPATRRVERGVSSAGGSSAGGVSRATCPPPEGQARSRAPR